MEKEVVISIKGVQQYVDAPADAIEFVTEGHLRRDDAGYTLTYQESELTGLGETQTTIQIAQGGTSVTMLREGEINTQMVFQHGGRHMALYNTQYGELTISVNAHRVFVDMNDAGGDIGLDYDIELDHSVAGHNMFVIHVEEVKKRPVE